MKKISTSIDRLLISALTSLALSACAFTDYGVRINQEQLAIARLEEKRHTLETQYIIVLNSLELHPTDGNLIKERDGVRRKLLDLNYEINEKRKMLDQSYMEWEQKVVEERIQQEMVDKEIQENEGKDETIEFENR
jgi:hypothetical protein